MSAKVKAAAVYCRISDDGGGKALGVKRQEELCRELAERKGWPIAEVYVDNDISASSYSRKARPAYDRMLEALRAGERDAVICVDQDRLVRRVQELEGFMELADELAIPLANVAGDTDFSTSEGRFKARIYGSVAAMESEKKSERIRRERAQSAKAGHPHGPWRPFGYEDDRITIREPEAALVREAAQRVAAGEPINRIATEWGERGICGPKSSRPMAQATLREVLANPRIAGLRRHRSRDRLGRVISEDVYPAAWPAIVDRATFDAVQARISVNRQGRRAGRPRSHLLSGLLVCGLCGHKLAATGRRDKRPDGSLKLIRRYGCSAGPGKSGCGHLIVGAEPAEAEVRDRLFAAFSSKAFVKALQKATSSSAEAAKVAGELGRAETKLTELADDYADDRISRAEWLRARGRLKERIESLRRGLARLEGSTAIATLPQSRAALERAWEEGTLEWRRALLAAVVDRIVVKATGKSRRFDPERIEIRWTV